MEFQKERCFTVLNADELKVGSKVILADDLKTLKLCVENDDDIRTLTCIGDEEKEERFFNNLSSWHLAYLVEEPKEKKYRPFKDCDELIEKWNKDICPHTQPKNTMPLIWVMDKVYSKGDTELITGFTKVGNVLINGTNFPLQSLFECYTFLDGTPCGVMEK